MYTRSYSFYLIFALIIISTFFFQLECSKAGKDEVSASGQDEYVVFIVATEAKIRSTTITVEGKSHRVDIVTLSVRLKNPTAKSIDVDISANIQMIHPEKPDALQLIKKERGPCVVNLGRGKTQDIELEYIQMPGSPKLASNGRDFVFVTVPGHRVRVDLVRVPE